MSDGGPGERKVGRGGRKQVGRHRRGIETSQSLTGSEPGGPAAAPTEPGRSRRTTGTIVLAALCLPAIAAAVVFLVQTPTVPAAPSLLSASSEQAVTAAKSAVHAILSYDYRSIGADVARAKADTTGAFAGQYAGTAGPLLAQAKQEKAIVQATVGSSGVVSTADNNVVVLMFVDQASVRQVRGQKTPTTRIDQSRVKATMTLVNGKWLVSGLAAL